MCLAVGAVSREPVKQIFLGANVSLPQGGLYLLVLLVRELFLFAVLTCPFFMYGSGD